MSGAAHRLFTVEEFLAWDDGTDQRYELVHGTVVGMAPPSVAHTAIVGTLAGQIGSRLKRPCRLLAEAGIAVASRDESFYQADLAVTCTELPGGGLRTPDPVVIVEVTSPSTAAHDRGTKLPDYRAIPSVQEILLVSSNNRRVEHWRRKDDRWIGEDRVASGILVLASIDIEIDLTALYEGVLD